MAVCAVAILVAHLLVAQLTLVLAVVFALVGKTTRWRLWWLLAPAAVGLAWTLATGPDKALAGFAAGPSGILRYLSAGHLAGQLGHPLAAFGGAQSWLPRQFPVALICGAAEAALIGWLDWLHTDEWAVPPPRPGVIAAARQAIAARAIRAGAVVTRDGCALGIVPATGAIAELGWAEAACGTLVVGASAQEVTLACLQVVHAALRRRKPVIVLDPGDAAITRALAEACMATGTPLRYAEAEGASGLWGRGTARERQPADLAAVDLGRVVRERSAALLPTDTAELGARACTDLASLARDLRRIGVDGDALVWAPRGERVPAQAVAELLREGQDAGLSVLIGTTSPTAATELCGLAGTALIYRVADQDLAASLAARTGTRLLPAPIAAALAGRRPDTDLSPTAQASSSAHAVSPAVAAAPDLAPCPVIPARTLLTLGQAEFVLAVSAPRQRLITPGRMVPARLPRVAARLRTVRPGTGT
jgi:hypothetical protein